MCWFYNCQENTCSGDSDQYCTDGFNWWVIIGVPVGIIFIFLVYLLIRKHKDKISKVASDLRIRASNIMPSWSNTGVNTLSSMPTGMPPGIYPTVR
jgi:hypothetical protein